MSSNMKSDPPIDATYCRYLFQIDVRLAATEHGEKPAVLRYATVFLDKFQWQFQ